MREYKSGESFIGSIYQELINSEEVKKTIEIYMDYLKKKEVKQVKLKKHEGYIPSNIGIRKGNGIKTIKYSNGEEVA